MKEELSLISLRHAFSQVLAAAILELFPAAILLEARGTAIGFYGDFLLPCPLSKEEFPVIQEQMMRIAKNRILEVFEMAPISAAGLLRSRGQKERAQEAEEFSLPLIQMVRLGDFVNFFPEEPLTGATLDYPFKLVSHSTLEGGCLRLIGTAAWTRQELKQALEDKEQFQKQDYLRLGKELKLFDVEEEGWIYHPKGEFLKEKLFQLWRSELQSAGFSLISTPRSEGEESLWEAHQIYIQRFGGYGTQIAESAYLQGRWVEEAQKAVVKGEIEKDLISFLQLLIKISKMLRFEYQVVLYATRKTQRKLLTHVLQENGIEFLEERRSPRGFSGIELRIPNALGEWVSTGFLRLDEEGKRIAFSLFGSLEGVLSLVVEKDQGLLPLWLAPEQVRIFAVSAQEEGYARKVCQTLEQAGYRVSLNRQVGKLNQRVYEGLREKVPFSIVVGNREQATETIQVRPYLSTKEQMMNIATFIREYLENQ